MRIIREKTLTQLTYLPHLFPVNCYLVEEENSLTLIDAALAGNTDAIIGAAARIGKPITKIVLTHAHSDHIGALDRLKERNPELEVYISARDSRLLAGDSSLLKGEPNLPVRGGVPKGLKTKPDVLLQDGGRVGSLVAIASPGHTPGSMSFLDDRSGILIAGDAFAARGGLAVSGHMRLTFPFPALATWSAEISLDSARRLADLKPSILAVGHGNLIHDPVAAMRKAIAAADQKLKQRRGRQNVS
ncbi:MBL fold metallo-hydrolase [Paenibacillus sp. HB172176]|uniref:MBL fold metallo-hydrolase n=1 Tax=Paenibacillus sp. HB172176 TaxID=2493690 RepID=UPI00143AE742|nr:MBL fold metallo-hydrolase [Paenibacillus sp. HB172176]